MAKTGEGKTKVFWNGPEEHAVVQEAVAIVSKEPTLTMKEVLARAQRVLPEHRRRNLYSTATANLTKLVREELSGRRSAEKASTELPAPLPELAPDSIIEDLAETIGKAFAELFATALRSSVAHTKAMVEHPESRPARKRLQKLTIVGLMPAQKNIILAEFGNKFDLRFWKDESPHTLKSLTKSSDAVIAMTDWIAHGHQDLIKSVDPTKLRLVSGTVTRLQEYLASNGKQ